MKLCMMACMRCNWMRALFLFNLAIALPLPLPIPDPQEGARDRTQSDAASPDQVNISLPGAPDDMSNDRHGTMGTTAQDERAREGASVLRISS